MSQQEVAQAAGISLTYYGLIERGIRTGSISVCRDISRILGLTAEQSAACFLGKDEQVDG